MAQAAQINITRRAMLSGVAVALPSAALAHTIPSLAEGPALTQPASPMRDPVFAAIELHRKLEEDLCFIGDKLTAVEDGQYYLDRRPLTLIAWRTYSHIGGSEIARARREFLNEPGVDRATIAREYREKKAEYRALLKTCRKWDKKHGIDGLRDRRDAVLAERDAAGEALALAKPISVAGAAALVAYARTDLDISADTEWPLVALDNAVAALKQLDTAAAVAI